jgi:hypothetical protein
MGLDDMDDFELGPYLKGMGTNFFDQLDTGARFFNRGFTLNQSDKMYAGVEAMLPKALGGGATYDEALAKNRARNEELKAKNPRLATVSELGGAFTGIGKLQSAGVTARTLVPQVADKATKLIKALGFGGTVAAGAADTAAISAAMAYGDDKDAYDAAKSGALWGAAFSALPPSLAALLKSALAKRIGTSAKDMYDKAGNFIPIHLAKGDHIKLKTLYRQFVGEGLGSKPLLDQQSKVLADVEKRMFKVEAHDAAKGAAKLAANTSANRAAKAADVNLKNTAADIVDAEGARNAARITNESSVKLSAAEIKIKEANTKLQNQILNDARPSSAVSVTGVGTNAQKQLKGQWKNAYDDAWEPVTGMAPETTASFVNAAGKVKNSLNLPADKATVGNIITNFIAISKGGKGDLRAFDRELRKGAYSAGVKGDTQLQSAYHSLRDAFTLGLPKTTQDGLAVLNKKYPNYLVVKDAGNNAIKTKGIFTADQMYNSVKKVGKGTGATGEAHLQTQADVMGDTVAAQTKTLSGMADDTASQLTLNAEKAARAKVEAARNMSARNTTKGLERTDATNLLKKANAARTERHVGPFKQELDRLNASSSATNLKVPTQIGTSAAAGVPISLLMAPFTGGTSAAFGSPLVGAAQGRFLTQPWVQKTLYGHTAPQKFFRDEMQYAADLLRRYDKTNISAGFRTGVGATMASPKDKDEQQPRRRRRN